MGLYDTRCMLTGVSLHAIRAIVVLLHRAGAAYRPIALGIAGQYDRLGSIDGPEEDDHTDVVAAYFLDRMRDGRATLRAGDGTLLRPEDIEGGPPPGPEADWWVPAVPRLLESVERNNLRFLFDEETPYAVLDGVPVDAALIAEPVWDALAADRAGAAGAPVDALFAETFPDTAVPHEMYRRHTAQFADRIRQLHAVQAFVVEQGLVWAPPGDRAQRYPTDLGTQYAMDEFIDEARRDCAGNAALQAAFDQIEHSLVW
jgi:hypothetical protein